MAVVSIPSNSHQSPNCELATTNNNNNATTNIGDQLAKRLKKHPQNHSSDQPNGVGEEFQGLSAENLAERLESGQDAPHFVLPRSSGNLALDLTRELREKYGRGIGRRRRGE